MKGHLDVKHLLLSFVLTLVGDEVENGRWNTKWEEVVEVCDVARPLFCPHRCYYFFQVQLRLSSTQYIFFATNMFSCNGCLSKFNRQVDLIQHLQKSESLLCNAAQNDLQQKMRPVRGAAARSPSPTRRLKERPVAKFEGDSFGNDYTDVDFLFPEDDDLAGHNNVDVEEKSSHSDSEDKDDFTPAKAENSLHDPMASSHPPSPPVAVEMPMDMDIDEDDRLNLDERAQPRLQVGF